MTARRRSSSGFDSRVFAARFAATVLLFVALSIVGGIGYQIIEGWNPSDSLYMAVITLTAVGYHEVHPLGEGGRTFTMLLLAGGFTWMGLWFALITSFIVELDLGNVLRRRKVMREIGRMSDHVIVCGAGRTGRQVVQELEDLGEPWVVIERENEPIADLMALIPDAYPIQGDATHDHVLLEAGLEAAPARATW